MGLRPWLACIAPALLALPLSASASLGGDSASVQADQLQSNAQLRTTSAANYTLFEFQTPAGTTVREYLSPTGLVFAIVWEGPSLPNLQQLLGNYFASYIDGANADAAGARARLIDRPGLLVYAGGRMRAFLGKALVPELIPQGVTVEDIR